MTRATTLTPKQVRPVHSQIMRRIAPIIVLAFAAFAVIAVIVFYNSIRLRIDALHQDELNGRATRISDPIRRSIDDVLTLAAEDAAREFGAETKTIVNPNDRTIPRSQRTLLQGFINLLNANPTGYFAVRFILPDGSIWSEVTNQNGILSTISTIQPGVRAGDVYFSSSLRTQDNVVVSPILIRNIERSSASQVVMRLLAPVRSADRQQTLLGVIEIELLATPILDTVNIGFGQEGQRWLLINNQQRYLADSTAPRKTARSLTDNFYGQVLAYEPDLSKVIVETPGDLNQFDFNGAILSSVPIRVGGAPDMPWQLILIDSSGLGASGLYLGVAALIGISIVGAALMLNFISGILRRRLSPLLTANELAQQLASGHLDDTLPPAAFQDDELGALMTSFDRISSRLTGLSGDMEEQITRFTRNLDVAAKVSREATSATDAEQLLVRVIDMLCDEFDLYHAQVYLLDDIALNAVLAYSRGSIGEKLLQQNQKIPVGSRTMVGQVAATGEMLLVNDTHIPGVIPYQRNPLLPDARGEITLPLTVGGKVIGVLDIFSARVDTFGSGETRVLALLADQFAIALYNTRLLSQSHERIQQVDTLNRQLTRNAWEDLKERSGLEEAYRYDLMSVEPTLPDDSVIEAISAPISIRGQVIGTIAAASPDGISFAQGDQAILRAIADRVGLAIEGARLFQETQTSLAVTSTLYELSRNLNESDTIQDVIRAILTSVMPDAVGGQVWLFDEYPYGGSPTWMQCLADYAQMPRSENADNFLKVRLRLQDSQFLSSMNESQVKVVTDLNRDTRLDDELKTLFRHLGAQAVIFVPFSLRGLWRGLLTVEFNEERDFSEREGRLYTALIDQAGVAVDNRLLIQQTEMTLDQIERLYSASRLINTSQGLPELVQAVVAATTNPTLNFEFGLLEGELDRTGWPTRVRKVAYSDNGIVREEDAVETLHIEPDSPLRRREPQMEIDPTIEPHFQAIFPLFSANQPIALLYVTSNELREMAQEDYEVYYALSGQMSTVLENRRLLEQTEDALDESRRLYSASRAIAVAQDSKGVYRAAADALASPNDYLSRASIALAGPTPGLDAAYFDYVHVWERVTSLESPITTGLRLTAEAAPFGRLMADSGELVYFRDLANELGDQNRLRQALERGGAISAVVVPLRTQRRWFGVMICEAARPNAFDEQYLRFAQAVADQVAIAVENRLLFDEAQLEAQRALALAEVGQLATRIGTEFERNISEVFARVAESAAYDRWLLMLVNEDEPERLDKITWHSPTLPDDNTDFSFDLKTVEHSLADAVRMNQMVVVNDPFSYPAFLGGLGGLPEDIGKHIATPIYVADRIVGALLIGRGLDAADLDERDEQLVRTLAAQVAVAIENRRLFRVVESEREYLQSILQTMPTGIMVLDAHTLKPIQVNDQTAGLLGKPIDFESAFSVEYYNLLRTGTNVPYPQDELPITLVVKTNEPAFSDDLAAIHDNGNQTDLLLNAAPIRDARGNLTAIVAAFQDISNLRGLENALQNNLRETIALYEATRALSEAVEMDDALDATMEQMLLLEPSDAYIVLLDEEGESLRPVRGLNGTEAFNLPANIFEAARLVIPNVTNQRSLNEDLRANLDARGIAALASVPLRARDSLLGWLVTTFNTARSFSPEDERYLTTLSDSAAVAIDNRNLYQRTEIAYQEAATLYETSRALADAKTPEDIVNAVVNHMLQPHITQVFMAVPTQETFDGSVEMMQVVASWQSPAASSIDLLGVSLAPDQFPAWNQVASPQLMMIDDALTDERLSDMERLGLDSTDTRSLAVLPLRANERQVGTIWISSSQPYRHGERDVRIYRSFIEQASLSMEATRLLKQTERRAVQLGTSAEVSRAASSILDIDVLMPRLVDLIRDAFNYDHVQIFLMDEDSQYAVLRASTGEAGRQLLSINHKLARGSVSVIGTVTDSGEPAIALDTADARFVHKPNPYLPLTRSEMAIPLLLQGRVVGALDVQSNQPNAFGDEDLNVLTTLAAQIAVALDNARLYQDSVRRAQDMGFLFNVTSAAANPDLSLTESVNTVVSMVRETFNALDVCVYLTETYSTEDGVEHTLLRAAALAGANQPLSEVAEIYLQDQNNLLAVMTAKQEPLLVDDVSAEPNYLPVTSFAQSALAVPMVTGNTITGVIVIEADEPNAYDEDTVRIVRAMTNTLAAIVQNNRLLEQMQQTNEQLRELDRLKSDFLANMSHELRTPLNSIIGFSRVILKGIDGPLTEMQEQDLTTIYNSGTHLLGLINDILDQAKISSGKMDLHLDYFDLKAVAEGVRSIGIGLVKDKPIDMRLEVASGLPKAYGDEFRTRQVLLNLVSNAGKFTQQGSVTIRIYTERSAETGNPMVRLDVQDTGIGIAEQDLPLLFEAFRQVDSSLTRTVGGTGLGLPIARSLIEMQGGQMLVHSEVNVGSTFSILIPTEPSEPMQSDTGDFVKPATGTLGEKPKPSFAPPPKPPTGELPPQPKGKGNGHTGPLNPDTLETAAARDKRSVGVMHNVMPVKRQILLIEENPDMVDQYRRTLQREGFDIFAASIPLEAQAMASGLHPTMIVMDVNFASGAGWEILERLQGRDDTQDIPIIVVTLSNELQRIMDAGAFRVIQRPFTPEQLVDAARAAEADSLTERILIIDDQPEATRLIKELLDEHGSYRVFTAHSGPEGVSMIARHRPDLIILDLRMPEMDGFAVLEELQSNPETAAIPVMVVTADTLNAEEQGQLAGVDVLYKAGLDEEGYHQFIRGIREHLGSNGDN